MCQDCGSLWAAELQGVRTLLFLTFCQGNHPRKDNLLNNGIFAREIIYLKEIGTHGSKAGAEYSGYVS
jgi:hypothetical protein